MPLISISLGRLPSAVCSSTTSSPRARKATIATAATATAGLDAAPSDSLVAPTKASAVLNVAPGHAKVGESTSDTVTATATATAPVKPGKTPLQNTSDASTLTSTAAAVSVERASLDIIIRKLLDSTELHTIRNGSSNQGDITAAADEHRVLILLIVALSRVQHVCSGAVALSLMLSSLGLSLYDKNFTTAIPAATGSSDASEMHRIAGANANVNVNATRSKSPHHLLSKGLFASPGKISIKATGPATTTTTNNATGTDDNTNENAKSGPAEEPLTCADLLHHMQHVHTAMTSIVTADNIHTSLASSHTMLYNKLVGSLDFTSQLHNACAKLTTSWQLCTLSLAQALFDDLAQTEGNQNKDGDDIMHSAPRYQSTQLDSFSLLFSAPTQSSQVHLHHQHHLQHNPISNHNKISPHKFSNTSPSQSSRIKTSLPSSYPNLDSPHNSAAASPMLQVVLCSAHPPAVQAAVDLCSVFIKVIYLFVNIFL